MIEAASTFPDTRCGLSEDLPENISEASGGTGTLSKLSLQLREDVAQAASATRSAGVCAMTGLAHFLLQLAENIAETAATATLGLSAVSLLA